MPRALYLVVPVLDEAPNLDRLFAGFRTIAAEQGELFDVAFVVVDDGSNDGTGELARHLGDGLDVTVLVHEVNRGPGSAFGTAFEHLAPRLRPDDQVVTLEGDNTSRHELLPLMLRRSEEGHDAVFASPYLYGGGIVHTHLLRILLSHIANTFVKEMLGIHGILTVSSFYRLYRGDCLQRLQRRYGDRILERSGFESMVEMTMKMIHMQMSISEVPMVLDTSLREGKSKLRPTRTALGYLALYKRKAEWFADAPRGR